MASDLHRRIKRHLADKHRQKWNRFSLYSVRKIDQIRELEAVVLRISDPTGNKQKGRLAHAENLRRDLSTRIEEAIRQERDEILGQKARERRKSRPKAPRERVRVAVIDPAIAKITKGRRKRLRAVYKGKPYGATLYPNGDVACNGTRYTSPSGATTAVCVRRRDGWRFWKYRNSKGEWVPLRDARRKRRSQLTQDDKR